jgi:eukaryotic-like serine/threonine-protein kinase
MVMQCPKCSKSFPQEKSFCPYDGSALVSVDGKNDFIGYVLDNKYLLEEQIGEGTTGKIFRATHLQLQAPIAIKLLRQDLMNNSTAIERFRREAYAAMKIRHPNAIAVMDFGITSDDLIYVVMEFLTGIPLSERLRQKEKLSLLEANNIIQQICAVLNIAHRRGIVHRDLKPDNIFLHQEDDEEVVKVVDFGIAKLIQALDGIQSSEITGGGNLIGTPHYISPEQCTAARPVDPRSDIYSLGIILYRMLSGKLPFEGPNSIAVIYKQITDEAVPVHEINPDIPPIISGVVSRAMEKNPDSRPKDVLTFSRELSAAIKTVTDQEFHQAFLAATDQDIEAAILLTMDESSGDNINLEYSVNPVLVNRTTGKMRALTPEDLTNTKPSRGSSGSLRSDFIPVNQKFLHGNFPTCDLASVVHTLVGLEVTGTLLVYTTQGMGREIANRKSKDELPPPPFCSMYFEQGDIRAARLGVRVGREAIFQLLQMPVEGSYVFKPALFLDELRNLEPIIEDGEVLWQEAVALRLELQEYQEIFPDLLVEFELLTEKLKWGDKVTRELAETVWYLILQPGMNLAQLLARSPACNAKTYRIINMLESTGLVTIVEADAEAAD